MDSNNYLFCVSMCVSSHPTPYAPVSCFAFRAGLNQSSSPEPPFLYVTERHLKTSETEDENELYHDQISSHKFCDVNNLAPWNREKF